MQRRRLHFQLKEINELVDGHACTEDEYINNSKGNSSKIDFLNLALRKDIWIIKHKQYNKLFCLNTRMG